MRAMPGTPELSIVLPTLNEAENLRRLIPEIEKTFSGEDRPFEIVVVDDASVDGTVGVAEEMGRRYGNVLVLQRSGERSLSASLLEGFDHTRAPVIACMDADLAHDPEDLAAMVRALDACDMVIGSRYLPGRGASMEGKSIVNCMASWMGGALLRRSLGLPYYDVSHSLRVFRNRVYRDIRGRLQCRGNAFLVEFLLYAHRRGHAIREIPVNYRRRVYGDSKLSVLRESVRMLLAVLHLRWEESEWGTVV